MAEAEAPDVEAAGKVSKNLDDDRDLISLANKRLTLAMDALSTSRDDELDDLRFFAATPDNQWQWPADVLATRGAVQGQTLNARPTLTINKLPQHVRQITNDQRQNRPSGKVIPVDDLADVEVAEVLNGVIRHIEYISDADIAYDTACENQVAIGEGYFRILTEYCDEMSFDQEIKIGRLRNSFGVYMDPTIQDPCGSDANWCFITEDLLKEEFEEQFPNATPISEWMQSEGIGDSGMSAWVTEKSIRIAEYFYCENEEKTLCLFAPIPQIWEGGAFLKDSKEAKYATETLMQRPVRERKTQVKSVKWCKLNGFEVLERRDWPGKWIPVVRVVGNEFEVDGDLFVSGIVRNAKDAQRMYNYWCSQEAEMLALAPKAPFIGYAGQFEGYETQWKTANINNWPYLEVNAEATDHDGRVLPLPQRAPPPLPQAGLIQAKMGASDDIKSTTGQYDPSLGAKSNETSGKAIVAREKQSDVGTFHYVDNLAKAIRFGTRQIIDLIPKVYTSERIARIIGLDGEVDHVKINPNQQSPVVTVKDPNNGTVLEKIYNPNIGRYDVMATTGPSYMTKRQEAVNAMALLLQGNQALWNVVGDLFVKNMDWPGAEEIAARIKKTIPPALLAEDDEESVLEAQLGQAKQVIEAQAAHIQEAEGMVKDVMAQAQKIKDQYNENEQKFTLMKLSIDEFRAETERLKAEGGLLNDAQERTLRASPDMRTGDPQIQ